MLLRPNQLPVICDIYASTSRTVGALRPRAQRSYSVAWRARASRKISYVEMLGPLHGQQHKQQTGRATADQGEARRTGGYVCYCILCYGMQRTMPVAGPLPFPTIAGVWKRRRRAGWRITGMSTLRLKAPDPDSREFFIHLLP